jgi:hypothetical protein
VLTSQPDKALLRQHKLNQIPGPNRFDLDDVLALLCSKAMGPGALKGEDATIWYHPKALEIHAASDRSLSPRGCRHLFKSCLQECEIPLQVWFGVY